jgi:hypothetical protein
MKNDFTILIALILCMVKPFYGTAQKTPAFTLLRAIQGDIVDFTVDNLDNIYIINSTGQVKKLNPNGDSVAVYNDVKKYGKVTLIDASNPMKLLIYYQDYSTIVTLDRILNVRGTIDLRKHNILRVRTIGLAYDNNIWIYDEVENKLKKIDDDGRVNSETSDFRLLFNDPPSPQRIFDHDGFVYLYDTIRGLFVFDYYGSLKNKIPIRGWNNVKILNKYVFGTKKDSLQRYEINTFMTREQNLPETLNAVFSINFTNKRLYALRNNALEIYTLQ